MTFLPKCFYFTCDQMYNGNPLISLLFIRFFNTLLLTQKRMETMEKEHLMTLVPQQFVFSLFLCVLNSVSVALAVKKKKYSRSLTSGPVCSLCVVNLSFSTLSLFFLLRALCLCLSFCPLLFLSIILSVVSEHVNTHSLSVSPSGAMETTRTILYLCVCVCSWAGEGSCLVSKI